ncbi:hypothetical protein [Actinokineospora sp.]|uniref:hypothetical protein n=1 Tax=Actinokineospora sp. TaxID=1872133 RepID=UPI0040384640
MPGAEDRIQAAMAELDLVIDRAQQDLYRFQRRNEPTPEDLQALQDAARRGDLGDDMRELARKVESGQDSWRAVFAGDSPNTALLYGHLDRMMRENREAIATALAEDDEFDPFAPSPDL